MPLALHYAARSDVGLLRDGNEDSGYAGPRLLVVADGMGGHVAGEVASAIAVASLVGLDEDAPGADLLDQLARAVHQANDELRRMAAEDPSLDGMGTTLTALLRAGSRLGLAHVGDSRCYLLRQGRLEQITRDHTFVQTLVDEGRISPEQAEQHPQRALITRALDGREDVEIDLSVREVRVGDRYLLCSDGLSNVVSAATIRDALAQADEPAQACERLLELALRGGGPDNVTCVIADVVDVSAAPPPVPEAVGAAAHDSRLRRPDPGGSSAERAAAHRRAASARADGTRGEGRQRRGQPPAARRGRWRLRPALVLSLLLGAPRISAGVLLAAPGRGGDALSAFAAENYSFFSNVDFTTMTTPALVVAGDADASPHLTVRGPEWFADPYVLAPGPKSLLTLFGAEHGLGGVAGYDAAETTDENPERVAAVGWLTSAYLRTRLDLDATAWQTAQNALATATNPLGRIESK